MASSIQLLRSNSLKERPFPGNLLDGQPAINTNAEEPGLFFKAADGSIVKIGPTAITSNGSPPNAGGVGQLGNTIGELWLDKSQTIPVLKVYDGFQWVNAGSGGGLGQKGDTGAKGDTGGKGEIGAAGAKGDKGEIGAKGDIGTTGVTGAKGDTGGKGEIGAKGDLGQKGDIGTKGAIGDKGDGGVKGDSGTSVTIDGSVTDVNDTYPGGGPNDPQGLLNYYFPAALAGAGVINEADGSLWVYDGLNWGSVGPIVGPTGDKGNIGLKGDKGDLGSKGDKGDSGAKGDLGVKGDIGNKGEIGAVGAKGDKGEIGVKGDIGTTGSKGDSSDQYIFDTIPLAQAAIIPAGINTIAVFVNQNIIEYKREAGATALVTAGGITWQYAGGVLGAALAVTIPDDYPDFQTAIQKLSVLTPLAGVIITVRQRTSTNITTPVSLTGGDYSHFVLSMLPVLDPSNPNLNKLTVGSGFPAGTPAFTFIRCSAPRIAFSLDCANIAAGGFNLSASRITWVGTVGYFIDNARYNGGESPDGCGIFANDNSDVFASGIRVRNSGRRSLHLTGSSRIKSHNSQWLNSGEINVFVSRGCSADFSNGVIITGGQTGIIIRRSIGALDNIVVSGCSFSGINSESGSTIGARGANVQNCVNGVIAQRGGRLDLTEGTVINNSGVDLRVETGGSITCSLTTTTNGSGNPNIINTNVTAFNRFNASGSILTDSASGQGDTLNTSTQTFSGGKTFSTSLTSPLFLLSGSDTVPVRGAFGPNAGDYAISTASLQRLTLRADGIIHTGVSGPSPTLNTTAGVRLNQDGSLMACRSSGVALLLQRSTSDGDIINFYRDTSVVGAISVTALGASFTGNAATATKLFTKRTINGTDFDGTNNITLDTVNLAGNQAVSGIKTFNSAITVNRSDVDIDGSSNIAGTSIGNVGLIAGTRSNGHPLSLNRTSTNGPVALFRRSGTTVGSISVTTTATTYITSSDYRLKENIVSLPNAISRLNQLSVYRFNFVSTPDRVVDGFLAHEAQNIVPEAVVGEKDAIDEKGDPIYQGIDLSKLVPLLTKALQEAIERIEALEQKIILNESGVCINVKN